MIDSDPMLVQALRESPDIAMAQGADGRVLHLTRHNRWALCGAATEGASPASTWGVETQQGARYCVSCTAELRELVRDRRGSGGNLVPVGKAQT